MNVAQMTRVHTLNRTGLAVVGKGEHHDVSHGVVLSMLSADLERTRINNRLPFAREGIPFVSIGTFFAIASLYFGHPVVAFLAGALSLFTLFFFRDPVRENHVPEKTVLVPADGKILDVRLLKDLANPLGEPAVKVTVFMSLFSVHVNRVPIGGKVVDIAYHRGKFFSAHLDKASEKNENNRITVQTGDGRRVVFVQIAGLIARRIVCWIKEGDLVRTGQRFGLIRFGSRLDVYLPEDTRIMVSPRHKVKAGVSILGYLS